VVSFAQIINLKAPFFNSYQFFRLGMGDHMINFKGAIIEPDEILSRLKQDLQLRQVCYGILNQRIVNQFAREASITITEAEIQTESDRERHENRLFRASDTLAWLSDQMITADDWEAGIRDRLLTEKLSHHLFDQEAERVFATNPLNFDQILLYRIVVPYAPLAQEIFYEIEEGEISFYEAAHLYDVDPKRRYHCGYEGQIYRWKLKPELSAILFSAAPGKVIGPLLIDQTSHLLMVEEFIPAELTPDRHKEILTRIFNEWLTTELNYLLNAEVT
jgi:parvulin-like peptidyl-prolyl isomerase